MKFIKELVDDIRNGENLDVYVGIVICVAVVVIDLMGIVKQSIVMAAVLLTLSLLSFGALSTRKVLANLDSTIKKLDKKRDASSFLHSRNESEIPFSDLVRTAHNIYIVGPTMINIFSQWSSFMHTEKLNQHGANIRVTLLDPDSQALTVACQNLNEQPENTRTDIARTLSHIKSWIEKGVESGSVEVRLIDTYLGFKMTLIDPEEAQGKIIVEFIGYKSELYARPHIVLNRADDGHWYEYYWQQYVSVWKAGNTVLSSKQKQDQSISPLISRPHQNQKA